MSTPEEPKKPETPPHNDKFNQLMVDVKKVLTDAGRILGPMATKGMHAAEEGIKKGVDLVKSQLNKPKGDKTVPPNAPTSTTTTTTTPINPPSITPETPRVTPIHPKQDEDPPQPPQSPKP